MIKKVAILSLLLVSTAKAEKIPYTKLFQSFWQKEASHQINPPIGDNGLAVGPLQIHPIMVDDCNRIAELKGYDLHFTNEDRGDLEKSYQMLVIYLDFYGDYFARKYSRRPTIEELGSMWNGGPTGFTKGDAVRYGEDVGKIYKSQND